MIFSVGILKGQEKIGKLGGASPPTSSTSICNLPSKPKKLIPLRSSSTSHLARENYDADLGFDFSVAHFSCEAIKSAAF